MSKRVTRQMWCIVAVLAVGTLLGTEALASTCTTSKTLSTQTCTSWRTTSSGVKYCTLWCTGSEICVNTISGLSGSISKECTTGENCPVTECTAYGTVDPDTGQSSPDCTSDLGSLNPACGLAGLAVCTNPNNHFNWNGTPYTLAGSIGSASDYLVCDKKGKCTTLLKLEPQFSSEICINPNWHFLTFTASEFKGQSCFCPGGYDGDGDCCETSERTSGQCSAEYGTGASAGTPTCILQLCTVDLSRYNPFTNFDLAYSCNETRECGGVTGTLCPGI